MGLLELQRIKEWHVIHRLDHPFEYHLFDGVLTVWMMGWVGSVPAMLLDGWVVPLCVLATFVPGAYVRWRVRAHDAHKLRCDWIGAAPARTRAAP